jgi:hypothetical protein
MLYVVLFAVLVSVIMTAVGIIEGLIIAITARSAPSSTVDDRLCASSLPHPYRLPYESDGAAKTRLKWWERQLATVEEQLNEELRTIADQWREERDLSDNELTTIHYGSFCRALLEFGE